MTVSDDDDDAQQLGRDAQIALKLQIEENIGVAAAAQQQEEEVGEAAPREDEEMSLATTIATAEVLLPGRERQDAAVLIQGEQDEADFDEISSTVARASSLDAAYEGDEEGNSDGSFYMVSDAKSSDMSSGVLVSSDEERKSPKSSDVSSVVLVSSDEGRTSPTVSSSDIRSSDISSSYAAMASRARDESDEDGITDGVMVMLQEELAKADVPSEQKSTERVSRELNLKSRAQRPYRNDSIFQALLGEYDEEVGPLRVNISQRNKGLLATSGTALAEAARKASLVEPATDPKMELEQYCERATGSKPDYKCFAGSLHDGTFQTIVQHLLLEDEKDKAYIGYGQTQLESEMDAARKALASLLAGKQTVAERARSLTISFRAAAAKLPFCLRFQLERCILSRSDEPVQLTKLGPLYEARKVMLVFISVVLPPLLDVEWADLCGQDCITLVELFALEIWESLVAVKRAIKKGNPVDFSRQDVQPALQRAREILQRAESVCDTTEVQLGQQQDIEIIRKRSRWPVAMYSAKFDRAGNLVPTDFQVLNIDVPKYKFVQPQTRRAMREVGWPVRGRFLIMSSVKLDNDIRENIVRWLKNACLCNRQYVYLFDKGTGKPTIWLYSQPPAESAYRSLSREALLGSLGCFDSVAATKLGDRISLAFTQTSPVDEIPLDCIVAEPEIVGSGYRFSDGCGVMGPGIAKKVKDILLLDTVPGAIQIRMGGVKGMLSYKHDFPEDKIGIRPSMVKFRSNHRILEVKQVAFVNENPPLFSQLIQIMHFQGVPNRILLLLQAKACAEMAREVDTGEQTIASDFDYYSYARKVTKHGRKGNGLAFTAREFDDLKRTMEDARMRVNLQCDVQMLFGVIDEHGVLEEGQVLVRNGDVEGPVLIARSPCLLPGDIQKAHAVAKMSNYGSASGETYSHLKNAIVFSAKGQRPLADCLGGGDLDGDLFYVITESALVDSLQFQEPYDYGSQSSSIKMQIDVNECFLVPVTSAPDLMKQLDVLVNVVELGNIVADSSDAWTRVADIEGPGSSRAIRMADLHQRALDARKLTSGIDHDRMKEMDDIRRSREYEAPHWRCGPGQGRFSNSILGILYNIWDGWCQDLEAARVRRSSEYHVFAQDSPSDLESLLDTDTVVSTESACIMCRGPLDAGRMRCFLCGETVETVWLCSGECKRMHETDAGHTCNSDISFDQRRVIESAQEANEPIELMQSATKALLDVTFGRSNPTCHGAITIDFRSLTRADLKTLQNMVLVEFNASLKESKDGRFTYSSRPNNKPRDNDVFLMPNGELVVCRTDSGGSLAWYDKEGICMHLGEVSVSNRRVASLSGTCRILESLMIRPPAGSLMERAMKREVFDVATMHRESVPVGTDDITYLNDSQQRVVQAALSMQSGILAVQGPPGCGKSTTIVEIVSVIERRVIVTAPSNAAVANLARKLISTGNFTTRDVVVFGENCDESVHFLNPVLRDRRWKQFWKKYQQLDDAGKRRHALDFASWLHITDFNLPKLITRMANLARLESDDPTGTKALASAKVLLCTLNTAGSPKLRNVAQFKFDVVLLDEASQAPEAECYIIWTFPGVKRVIIVGDPMQLPATVTHEGCRNAGYAESFLSHVFKYQKEKVLLLDVQYRMDPKILAFSNATFYSNRIKSDDSVIRRKDLVSVKEPFQIVNTSEIGDDLELKVGTSWENECELVVIKSVLFTDQDVRRVRSEIAGARTIVITPYDAQARLLRGELKKIKSLRSWDVATVDSFQGQESDIVIVSTVRTKRGGFVDNPNRLNVALTRAKYVLRVVGNMDFFKTIRGQDSTLKKLAAFAEKYELVDAAEVREAWGPPDWSVTLKFEATKVPTFAYALRGMSRRDKNIAYNTLHAVCAGDPKKLTSWPVETGPPRWQLSSIRGYEERLVVVWIAKEFEQADGPQTDARYVGVIEAHFAGTFAQCLNFKQRHTRVPRKACRIRSNMSAIIRCEDKASTHSTDVELSWPLTNEIQDAMLDGALEELPSALFELDANQKSIVRLTPPLLLESRSGMGKTECLLQHSLSFLPRVSPPPICFVTVSPNLARELQRRYNEVLEIEEETVPLVSFYSFLGSRAETGKEGVESLVDFLLRYYRVSEMSVSSSCTFLEYVRSRTSHEKLEVEEAILENEIGGVILGSLAAAEKKAALTREDYMEEIRSNIKNDTEEGRNQRKLVYDEYEKYHKWKRDNDAAYDTNDIVLRLVRESSEQRETEIFQAAYLDEVQDFSYASIFLICSIAGKAKARWTAAGDTAQMISPGCSFTFAGLKQTLRAIDGDIELRKAVKLKRNYRMNKGTLEMANAIINVIKKNFPDAIESFQEEEAMKDLGLNVALLDWKEAINIESRPSFGVHQAIVYASDNSLDAVNETMNQWLNQHPFILSSLDSKGLEFDDVVVAFDFDRKTWDVEPERAASLRMCRELYVAVTRARRRVVVLVKSNIDTMVRFFESLDCDLDKTDPTTILQEFDKTTAPEDWFKKGTQLFEKEQYKLAASCFNAAESYGWSVWAQGHDFLVSGDRLKAKDRFSTAARKFLESRAFKECLDVLRKLGEVGWNDADNEILDAALMELPDYLPREQTVEFAIFRGSWNTLSVSDLANYSKLFLEYRDNTNLKKMVQECFEDKKYDVERYGVEKDLPLMAGDYHLEKKSYASATRLFLRGKDRQLAVLSTEAAIGAAKRLFAGGGVDQSAKAADVESAYGDLASISDCWREDEARSKLAEGSQVSLLVSLFESPREAAVNHATACMDNLGPSIVKIAVESTEGTGAEELHRFSRIAFEADVLDELKERYRDSLVDVVRWYHERHDMDHAVNFASSNLTKLSDEDLLGVVLQVNPPNLLDELTKRSLLVEATRVCLSSGESFDVDFAKAASDKALSSVELASQNMKELLKVWKARRNHEQVSLFLRGEVNSSPSALLWLLFDDPDTASKNHGKKCMRAFGKDIVRMAVLEKNGADKKSAYNILCRFDRNAFVADKPAAPKRDSESRGTTSRESAANGTNTTNRTSKDPEGTAKLGENRIFKVLDRIVVTGLKSENLAYLNEKPGVVTKVNKRGSWVRLDSDKPGAKPHGPLEPTNLRREESESESDSSDDSGPPRLTRRGGERRNNDSTDSDSSDSAQQRPQGKKASRGASGKATSTPKSSDSSMPSLFQQGNKSSSSEDESTAESEDMPELESKKSSEESSDSDGAFPKGKQRATKQKRAPVPTEIHTGQDEEVSSSDDDEGSDNSSVPPLQPRPPPRDQDDSSDSSASDVPHLVSGENSSDDSSIPDLEPPRQSRNESSDDSSNDSGVPKTTSRSRFERQVDSDSDVEVPMPGLEFPSANSSSDEDDDSSGSSKPPTLKARLPEQDSSDEDSPLQTFNSSSDEEVPDLMDRHGTVSGASEAQGGGQQQQQQQRQRNAGGGNKKKNRGKKKKGRGGRGGKR